jgi:hypothetical protein
MDTKLRTSLPFVVPSAVPVFEFLVLCVSIGFIQIVGGTLILSQLFLTLSATKLLSFMPNNTIKVELLSDKALVLLQQLEQLKILRLITSDDTETAPKRRWAGTISKKTAGELLEHIDQSRKEWERDF